MKKLLNLLYTFASKTVIVILIMLSTWFMGTIVMDVMVMYSDDNIAVINVLLQWKDYNYHSSYFLKKEIETAIEDVLEYSLVYHHDEDADEEDAEFEHSTTTLIYLAESFISDKFVSKFFIDAGFIELTPCEENKDAVEIGGEYFIQSVNTDAIRSADKELNLNDLYIRATDDNYSTITEHLESLNNFKFAVVNHDTDKIVSNVPSIHGKNSGINVRKHFGEGENILAVRNSNHPYYESGTMTDYVDFVSETSEKYTDNFDLYISFGDNMEFAGTSDSFFERHNTIQQKISHALLHTGVFAVISALLFLILMIVSGKREPGGKVYPSLSDRLPNDLKLVIHFIIYTSMTALYESSLYMAIRTVIREDYWFNFSPEFYTARANISMVVMVCVIISLCCSFKRQLRCGTLLKNTYIYRVITNFRKAEPENDD